MSANSRTVARFVSVTMGLVIGLTFLFGFGNVLNLALKLQVPVFVAPLVAPAVDLTVLGHVGTRHLALSGASEAALRSARRLLLAASVVTLLLNVADPVFAGQWGQAAFDSVGPLLLIGVCEKAGPGLLRALSSSDVEVGSVQRPVTSSSTLVAGDAARKPPECPVVERTGQTEAPNRRTIDSMANSWSGLVWRTLNTGNVVSGRSQLRPCGSNFGSARRHRGRWWRWSGLRTHGGYSQLRDGIAGKAACAAVESVTPGHSRRRGVWFRYVSARPAAFRLAPEEPMMSRPWRTAGDCARRCDSHRPGADATSTDC